MNTTRSIHRGLLLSLPLMLATMGCQTISTRTESTPPTPAASVLLPGDEVEISVFGIPDLNATQRIRPDGKISVKLFGDIAASGKTPSVLRDELIQLYASQVQVNANVGYESHSKKGGGRGALSAQGLITPPVVPCHAKEK